jgi:hypothetical protein
MAAGVARGLWTTRCVPSPQSLRTSMTKVSSSDAFLIFQKWIDEQTPVFFGLGSIGEDIVHVPGGQAILIEMTSGKYLSILTKPPEGDGDVVVMGLSDAEFEYADSREGVVPELAERKWACYVSATFPSGRVATFGECRL